MIKVKQNHYKNKQVNFCQVEAGNDMMPKYCHILPADKTGKSNWAMHRSIKHLSNAKNEPQFALIVKFTSSCFRYVKF